MKTLLLTITCAITLNSFSQSPSASIQWQNLIAGNNEDLIHKTIETTNSDYISVGKTRSTIGVFSNYYGNGMTSDGWITKINAQGNIIWKKIFGGTHNDYITDVIQTLDNNYIAVGVSASDDGDLDSIPYSNNTKDLWMLKFNENGSIIWQKKYGGSGMIGYQSVMIKESSTGELHLFASTPSKDFDIQNPFGPSYYEDIAYFKLSSLGTIIQQKNFGGSDVEELKDVISTNDGGFVVLSKARSNDYDISQHLSDPDQFDAWVFKIDGNANIIWEKSFLQNQSSQPSSIKELSNGNIIFSSSIYGTGTSFGDGALTLISSTGNLIWQKQYGGSSMDKITDVIEINSNILFFAGNTYSQDGSVTGNNIGEGIWLVQIDAQGNIIDQSVYGGSNTENGAKLTKTNDGSLILSGSTDSNDFDVINPYSWGCFCHEAWIVKVNPMAVGIKENKTTNHISIYPNPAKDLITIDLKNSSVNTTYEITNAIGQTILSGKLEQEKSTVNISELSSGVYILQIGDEQKQSYKLIKE